MADTPFLAGLARCELSHAGQEFPFCDNYGCMSVRPLVDEIERLKTELANALAALPQHTPSCMCQLCISAYGSYIDGTRVPQPKDGVSVAETQNFLWLRRIIAAVWTVRRRWPPQPTRPADG